MKQQYGGHQNVSGDSACNGESGKDCGASV